MYFPKSGEGNTKQTLKLAAQRARELGIDELVLATTTGDTAKQALKLCPGMKITAVGYHAGFKEPFKLTMDEKTQSALREKGVNLVFATHTLSGIERGLSNKLPGLYPTLLVAQTLKLFGQGVKVAVEVAVMAADSGFLSGRRILAVGGSSRGADSALVLTPVNMNNFMDLIIHEIVCKPNLFKQ